jgi:hypothetical protein
LGFFTEDGMTDNNPSQPQTADSFRGFEQIFKDAEVQRKEDTETAAATLRQEQVESLKKHRLDDAEWNELLGAAQKAAQRGEKQFLLLRFPSDLCTDGARAINNPPNDSWPQTLRGKASDIYQRWRETLQPHGFGLSASVTDFPGGRPGDVGLFLQWGEAS